MVQVPGPGGPEQRAEAGGRADPRGKAGGHVAGTVQTFECEGRGPRFIQGAVGDAGGVQAETIDMALVEGWGGGGSEGERGSAWLGGG